MNTPKKQPLTARARKTSAIVLMIILAIAIMLLDLVEDGAAWLIKRLENLFTFAERWHDGRPAK